MMDLTSPQRKILSEGEFDSHELIEYKIQNAIEKARELEGWDVFATPREQNINLMGEDYRTVVARFFEKGQALEWARIADGDDAKIQKWNDERFGMPCFLLLITYYSPGYEKQNDDL